MIHQIYTKGGFKSGTDWPTSCFIEDLVEMYPSAKVSLSDNLNPTTAKISIFDGVISSNLNNVQFIHCERSSPELWRKSLNETIGRMQQPLYQVPCLLLPGFALSMRPILAAMNGRAKRTLGGSLYGPLTDVKLYHAHNEHIRKVVPKERLLIFDPKEGFAPLCEFLGVPVPKDDHGRDLPYPHVNDREAITKVMNQFVVVDWMLWIATFAGVYLAVRQWTCSSKRIWY